MFGRAPVLFSVIVPTCDRPELLQTCLYALISAAGKLIDSNVEVIVTDDSDKGSLINTTLQEIPGVKFFKGPSKGPAANRNFGASMAKGEWLLFTDDDCIPGEAWIGTFTDYIESHPEAVALEGRTIATGARTRFDQTAPVNLSGGEFFSCNMAIRADLFRQLGGFNAQFPYAILEDVEFKERVEAQARIVFVPDAVVYHPWRRIQSKNLVNRLLESNRVYLKAKGRSTDWLFRLNRTKLLVTCTWQNALMLLRYKGRGTIVFIKMCQFYLAMIFLRLKQS